VQLIIEFNHNGEWAHKYNGCSRKRYKVLNVPRGLLGMDWIIGTTKDNREAWRKKLDDHTKNADYEIITK